MPLTEFELINQYSLEFAKRGVQRKDVLLGIGDDCAILNPPHDQQLVVTTDTFISGVHFPEETKPHAIGYKALAVNLSDLAAMGADPAWVTMALTLPKTDPAWLSEFSKGFFSLLGDEQAQLIGGDTCAGSLSITIQAIGFVPPDAALRRDGAQSGDCIYVSGKLGDAALSLAIKNSSSNSAKFLKNFSPEELAILKQELEYPEPRLALGQALRGLATAAIDISDGLAADLSHILQRSGVGAEIHLTRLPLSEILRAALSEQQAWQLALTGGDDYELCFTIPKEKQSQLAEIAERLAIPLTLIGEITSGIGLTLRQVDGDEWSLNTKSYQHFSAP